MSMAWLNKHDCSHAFFTTFSSYLTFKINIFYGLQQDHSFHSIFSFVFYFSISFLQIRPYFHVTFKITYNSIRRKILLTVCKCWLTNEYCWINWKQLWFYLTLFFCLQPHTLTEHECKATPVLNRSQLSKCEWFNFETAFSLRLFRQLVFLSLVCVDWFVYKINSPFAFTFTFTSVEVKCRISIRGLVRFSFVIFLSSNIQHFWHSC